jgi:hypothetical protein
MKHALHSTTTTLGALTLVLAGCGSSSETGSGGGGTGGTGGTTTTSTTAAGGAAACGHGDNTAAYALTSGSATVADASYSAAAGDESAVCVSGASVALTLTNPTIVTTGDSSSGDDSSFYGLNAGALAYAGGKLSITGGSITTSGSGANGVFAYGTGSTATLSGTTIHATGDGGHGVECAGGGALSLTNVTATSAGGHGSVVATDRGGGTITITGGSFTASGQRSAGIYSTGSVSASDATFTATSAEAVVIEGLNDVVLKDCTLASTNASEERGIFVYQSMSGDSLVGTGKVTLDGGSYSWSSTSATSAAFYVTNTTAVISLSDVDVTIQAGYLLHAEANASWGTSGANGGKVTFTAVGETLDGDLVADAISTIDASFTGASTLTGAVDAAKTAKSVSITLDATSFWNVTAASRVTTLAGVELSGTAVVNVLGAASVCYATSFTDTTGAVHTSGSYTLPGGGTLAPCG